MLSPCSGRLLSRYLTFLVSGDSWLEGEIRAGEFPPEVHPPPPIVFARVRKRKKEKGLGRFVRHARVKRLRKWKEVKEIDEVDEVKRWVVTPPGAG